MIRLFIGYLSTNKDIQGYIQDGYMIRILKS